MASHSNILCMLLLFTAALTMTVSARKINISLVEQTKLHFWFHEIRTGPNITRINVVPSNFTSGFGGINVFDNLLLTGTEIGSPLVGRAEGVGSRTSLDGSKGWTAINLLFTQGKFNGSSLVLIGSISTTGLSERPIVSGTGLFRMAKGFAINNFFTTSYGVKAEFNVTVFYNPNLASLS